MSKDIETEVINTEEKAEAKEKEIPGKFSLKKKPGRRKPRKVKIKPFEKEGKGVRFLSAAIDIRDRAQIKVDESAAELGKNFAKSIHDIAASYRNSRRTMGAALLAIAVIAASILIIFDRFTVYEYAYNGKVLGYVKEQEEVTDVLGIAGEKLTENSGSSLDIEFVPNQNITFNLVDSRDRSLDDSDTAVNKLVYMTDIETEAYGVYDGDDLKAIVKSNEDAENLLNETMNELSTPDQGMELVSAEFGNPLDIKPLNVLLTSVQDNTSARQQMVEGGEMEITHIVEDGENLESLARDYAVESDSIFDENKEVLVNEPEAGDKVHIQKTVEPVSVKMTETGRIKEVVEFKTIKKESDKYYKGDTIVEQEGRDGYQTFEGTITKEGGVEVDRQGEVIEEQPKVRNKIILVGTAERPKTAPTGTYAMPIGAYTLTSTFGPRWGRMHTGLDMAAPTGSPIYASDGGTVVRAGYNGGYGNCVDIDHGNGRVTRYAHCSRLLVSVGEQVYQRQNIALVGSTGNSTGPHLHFEVILNGSAVNPAPKLGL
ncbi:MAG: peptidoglycan DD-metalloendopeptidase family protein [Mogibacterium sp.]|nr:peptidoglycan DD-metalloendopeptidase family protein [Mogibacterium sp.]